MNERIKELAISAGYGNRWNTTEQFDTFLDCFAELIVRECAQFIFVLDAEPVSHKSAARMLQEHFGVE